MPRGTPLAMKCPKCKGGTHGAGAARRGVRATGKVEAKITRSTSSGSGSGGRAFVGHRGQVECLDCGHIWFSTHRRSGRKNAE